jgi:hypothetical protein
VVLLIAATTVEALIDALGCETAVDHARLSLGCKEARVLCNGAESFDVRGVRTSNPLKGWELDVGR